jgi:1,4-alpha-glucan branching enzyme
MIKGYWVPILHSHLPFVKHPKYENFLEEHWLFEAITECYIPLLRRLKKLEEENVHFRLTTSVTPPLAEMLSDEHLMKKYRKYLDTHIELGNKEIERTRGDEYFHPLAHFYRDLFVQTKEFFEGFLAGNVLNGYKHFYYNGSLEVITCGATHGYLPILSVNEHSVRTQIEIAVQAHEKHFGKKPNGIWLPECAYYDGLDKILNEKGIKFFIVDSHALTYGRPTALNGVYTPTYTPTGVAAFARDALSSKQVWSSKEGYPGDFEYRDFYRDIGYDLDFDYIKPYINPDGIRVFTGFKYHKITGTSDYKEAYDPWIAENKTKEHAENFHWHRELQFDHLGTLMNRIPMVVSPYDAELFGHWWFEGPEFLCNMFRQIDKHKVMKAVTPMEYLGMYPKNQVVNPNPSSWGDKGYYDVWLNSGNDWIYRHLHQMADVMEEKAKEYFHTNDKNISRVLTQMLRELLLAQSSDWAFLMTTGTASEYSINRTKEHISNFNELLGMINDNNIDFDRVNYLEYKNSIFDFIDFRIFITS